MVEEGVVLAEVHFAYLRISLAAYVILIYLSSIYAKYKAKVQGILRKLGVVGLYLDIGKSKFFTKKTKYLGFIIEAR